MRMLSPKGASGFSSLTVARGFKGAEENKTYSQELVFTREEGMRFVEQLQNEITKLHVKELERLRSMGKSVRPTVPDVPYKETADGMVSFNFRRKEADGQPLVVDKDNNQTTQLIRRGNIIEVAFEIRLYTFQGKVGATFKLLGVKVLDTSDLGAVQDLFGAPTETTKETKKDTVEDLF